MSAKNLQCAVSEADIITRSININFLKNQYNSASINNHLITPGASVLVGRLLPQLMFTVIIIIGLKCHVYSTERLKEPGTVLWVNQEDIYIWLLGIYGGNSIYQRKHYNPWWNKKHCLCVLEITTESWGWSIISKITSPFSNQIRHGACLCIRRCKMVWVERFSISSLQPKIIVNCSN